MKKTKNCFNPWFQNVEKISAVKCHLSYVHPDPLSVTGVSSQHLGDLSTSTPVRPVSKDGSVSTPMSVPPHVRDSDLTTTTGDPGQEVKGKDLLSSQNIHLSRSPSPTLFGAVVGVS